MRVVSINDIGGEVVKDNEVYLLKDNKTLNNLVLSSTFLKANQCTNGHKHEGQEEVYMFISGKGEMEIDGIKFNVREGDCILIEDGEFHKVYNTSHLGLYFVCVFDGKRNH
jgi:mannose-6-phosphate isomerase-like protein (cupin superfamily)